MTFTVTTQNSAENIPGVSLIFVPETYQQAKKHCKDNSNSTPTYSFVEQLIQN